MRKKIVVSIAALLLLTGCGQGYTTDTTDQDEAMRECIGNYIWDKVVPEADIETDIVDVVRLCSKQELGLDL